MLDGMRCLRISGSANASLVQIRPETSVNLEDPPPMAGDLLRDGGDMYFVPRFGFVGGTTYVVSVDGTTRSAVAPPRQPARPTAHVVDIYPSARVVPRNLLRLYVRFSTPMRDGQVAGHVKLVGGGGATMVGALFSVEYELWDREGRRLTLLLDPARIKRGLVPHEEAGYPLEVGAEFEVVVDQGFLDASGAPMTAATVRGYEVGGDERRRVDPTGWKVSVPSGRSHQPLEVGFDRPLDHELLGACLRVLGPDGRSVDGTVSVAGGELSWSLTPSRPWDLGPHRLCVDPILEDLAGNSLSRVFDRDLTSRDDDPRPRAAAAVPFVIAHSGRSDRAAADTTPD